MTVLPVSPLADPLNGASFGQAIVRFFRKFATFTGRASPSEYRWWQLATFLVYIVLALLTVAIAVAAGESNSDGDVFYLGPAPNLGIALMVVWFLATLVPQLAIAVRRLHDANLSGCFRVLDERLRA